MAFFKFRQRGQPAPEAAGRAGARESAAGPQETVDSVRRRARHRLVGAAVLVLLAVIGFPLLFDTQPRPVAVNAPITIPDKDKVAPLKIPEALPADASLDDREEVVARGDKPAARTPVPVPVPVPVPAAPTRSALTDNKPATPARDARPDAAEQGAKTDAAAKVKADEAARAKADAAAKAKAAASAKAKADEAARAKAEQAAARAQRDQEAQAQRADEQASAGSQKKAEDEARAKREAEQRAKREEAARARAALEGRKSAADTPATPAADKPGRYIVQVGAFADETAAREARQKAERTGVKTYTQVVDTKDGKRTRVRVGPFDSREEADKAATALKKAGLAGAILAL